MPHKESEMNPIPTVIFKKVYYLEIMALPFFEYFHWVDQLQLVNASRKESEMNAVNKTHQPTVIFFIKLNLKVLKLNYLINLKSSQLL